MEQTIKFELKSTNEGVPKKNNKTPKKSEANQNQDTSTAKSSAGTSKPKKADGPKKTREKKAVTTKTKVNDLTPKYNPATLLYIQGVNLEEGQTSLKFVEKLLNDLMKLEFRASEVLKGDNFDWSLQGFLNQNKNDSKPIVVVLPSPGHVQDVLKLAPKFKRQHKGTYDHLHFDEFLNTTEQLLVAGMMTRIDHLNKCVNELKAKGQLNESQVAQRISKNSFKHFGYEFTGQIQKKSTIVWTSSQIIDKTGSQAQAQADQADNPDDFTVL